MGNKITKTVLLLIATSIVLIGCTKNENQTSEKVTEETTKTESMSSEEKNSQKYEIEGQDLETDKLLGPDLLTKDINIVSIWQPSCPPCEEELKIMEAVHKEFQDINFIGLAYAEDNNSILGKIQDLNLTFNNYRMTNDFLEKYSDKISSTPTTLYLDKEGYEIHPIEVGSTPESDFEKAVEAYKEKLEGLIDEQK